MGVTRHSVYLERCGSADGGIGEAGGRDFGVSEISFANKTRTV